MVTINLNNHKIISAKYGAVNNYVNVLPKINELMKDNIKKFTVNNNTFECNPYYGKIKKLLLILENKTIIHVNENDIINLIYDKKKVVKSYNISDTITNINKKPISNEFILFTNIRDENNILEWIIYHLLIGFDQIFIIDHKSKNPIENIINCYNFKHRVKIIKSDKKNPAKMYFLNNIILPYIKRVNCKYFIHLNGDEYINLNNNFNTIKDVVEKYPNVDILVLHYLNFGSNNKEINNNKYGCLLPTYTKCDKKLSYSFKCLIKINNNIDRYISKEYIVLSNKTVYTNVLNKNVSYSDPNMLKKLYPNCNLKKLPCFINNYCIQSKEDYMKRKIYRTNDNSILFNKYDSKIMEYYNNITYDNINKMYYDKIYYIINNGKSTIGFIILRYVRCNKTNKLWQKCYDNIRYFYDNEILIIDDNSNKHFITDKKLKNCRIINSKFPRRGEILPYYYYYNNKFCDRVVILHDSMFIKRYIDFINIPKYNNFTRLFSFGNGGYNIDISYFKKQTSVLKNGKELYKFHMNNINNLIGCFGVCSVIDHVFLEKIQKKYNIINLISCISKRDHRKTLERLLSCIFEKENIQSNINTRQSLLGDIFKNVKKQRLGHSVYIEKQFIGR